MKLGVIGVILGIVILGLGAFFFLSGPNIEVVNLPPKNNIIVAFGDSLTSGVGSTKGGDYVSVLSKQLERNVINHGVSGDTTEDALKRIDDVLLEEPGIALVMLGANDALRRIDRSETYENLSEIITQLQESGAVVVLLGVKGGVLGDPYDEMYEKLAEEYGAAYAPNVLEGILLRPELTYDNLHPNDAGYAIIADRVHKVLKNDIGI